MICRKAACRERPHWQAVFAFYTPRSPPFEVLWEAAVKMANGSLVGIIYLWFW